MENLYHLVLPTTVYNCLTIKYCELMGGFQLGELFQSGKIVTGLGLVLDFKTFTKKLLQNKIIPARESWRPIWP